MKNWYLILGIAAVVVLSMLVNVVRAPLYITDNTNVAVPVENGTSTNLNVTSRMQQYVGFFGRVWAEVRLNATPGSGTMYNKSVTNGSIYFFKTGSTPTTPFSNAGLGDTTDLNFSLTGYYKVTNHFVNSGRVCGTNSVNHLNTTDNYAVGIFKDSAATPNYFVCTDIQIKISQNGFSSVDGNVAFEVIAPKTVSYQAYDIWIDGEQVG